MSQFLSLDKYENRMLNLVATHVARAETRVMLSRRVKHALVVAMGSRTLVLDPERALLFDVLLGAQLLSNRKQSEQSRRRRPFPRTTVGPWVAAGMAELMERFGRVQAVPGFERYTHGKELPVVVWNEVPWRKIREGEFTSGAESVVMPGLEFQQTTTLGWPAAFIISCITCGLDVPGPCTSTRISCLKPWANSPSWCKASPMRATVSA